MNSKILVTGATGTIGRALVSRLQASGVPFVAGVRHAAKAKETLALGDQETVPFDFNAPDTFSGATRDVNKVFLLGPPAVTHMEKLLNPFIDFLEQAGIRRVVYLSALNTGNRKESGMDFHAILENRLKADGFDYTILQPSFFAQNFKNYEWENITQRGITYAVAGTGKVAFTDVADIAAVAFAALTEEGHGGRTYRITGPQSLSYNDAAELLSKATGRHIVYPNPSPEQYTQALKAAGAPDFIAPYMITVYSGIARHEADLVTDDVEKVTGKKATPLEEVLQADFAGA